MSALKYYDTTTGTWKYLAQGVKGDKGDTGSTGATGPANTLTATAVAGVTASATITGTAPNQQLSLVLPKGDTGQGFTARGVYDPNTTYAPYDTVYYNGQQYSCKVSTFNNAPYSGSDKWDLFAQGFGTPAAWANNLDYFIGEVVTQSGSTYYAIQNSFNKNPTSNSSYWLVLAAKGATGDTGPQGPKGDTGLSGANAKFEAFLANAKGPVTAFPTAVTPSGYATSASAISGATVYSYSSNKFTFRGLNPTTYTNSSGTTYYRNNAGIKSNGLIFNHFWVEFDYYGQNFDIRYNLGLGTQFSQPTSLSAYAQLWVWVDGAPTTSTAVVVGGSRDVDRYYNVSFDSAKQRRIRILLGGLDFGGIGVKDVTETIFPVNQQLLKVAFIDGSWFAGSNGGTTNGAVNLANQLAVQYGEMLNVDYYNLSVQSTGYVRGGNTDPIISPPTIPDSGNGGDNWCSDARLDPIATIQPDLVVLLGTTNDDAFTGSTWRLSDHATYVYNGITSRAPNAKIVVFTRQSNTYYSSTLALNASTVYTAAKAHPSVIDAVNIYSEGWITGTMNTGSGSGTQGNGQIFIHTDDHPNTAGNKYYASRMFDRTYDIIKSYARS